MDQWRERTRRARNCGRRARMRFHVRRRRKRPGDFRKRSAVRRGVAWPFSVETTRAGGARKLHASPFATQERIRTFGGKRVGVFCCECLCECACVSLSERFAWVMGFLLSSGKTSAESHVIRSAVNAIFLFVCITTNCGLSRAEEGILLQRGPTRSTMPVVSSWIARRSLIASKN